MGRQKVHAPVGVVNPLQKAFGAYLRMRRKALSISAQNMAQELGINATYYRLIEAGRAVIILERIPDLIKAFSKNKVNLDFPSVALFNTASAILEKSLRCCPDQDDPLHSLAAYAELQEITEAIRSYFSFQENSVEQMHFLETTGYYAVRDFLETTMGMRDRSNPHLTLKGVPDESVEILRNLHRHLMHRPFKENVLQA